MLLNDLKTVSELLSESLTLAEEFGVSEYNIKLLLAEIIGCSIPSLPLNLNQKLTPLQLLQFSAYRKDLLLHKPIQYILGKTEFYGLVLKVNENVLIPRPETEGLVEWIVFNEKGKLRILDVGTGSGAIALALKNLNPDFNVSATDISHLSITTARENAKLLCLDVHFVCTDLFQENKIMYDVIVSNPPYISPGDYAILDDEVRLYEPKLALLAKQNGLEFYHRILKQASTRLRKGGKIYLETGETQSDEIVEIAHSCGYDRIEAKKDLTGRNRYLCIYNKDILTKRHIPD